MLTIYKKTNIKKIFLSLLIFTSAIFCFAETNFEKANKYYDEDNYSLAKTYYEYSLFNDNLSNGKLFYRLGYSYEQLKIKKSIYPKLYSAAAYCFERDNDKGNKYYSYALSKEKDFNINHKNYTEEIIQEIREELYWKTHKKNLSYFKKYPQELIWYSGMLLFLLLIIVALSDVIIKKLTDNKYYSQSFPIELSELFKNENYFNPTPDFINKLQNSYNNMVKNARYGSRKIYNPETFLLYKFGQVIFTKNGNEVDYKTVTKGLKQIFFTETNSVEASNLKINFLNKFSEFFNIWSELQKIYNEKLCELPELGILLSVLYSKIQSESFINNANFVIDVSNLFEKYKIKKYREYFIVIANKIYHEKTDENNLSKKLSFELNTITEKLSNKIRITTEKIFRLIANYLPIILFIYALAFIIHTSSLSLINFVLTGICCFIVYEIKSKLINSFAPSYSFSRLMTKAEREALDREIEEQAQRTKNHTQESTGYFNNSDTDNYESYKRQQSAYNQTQERSQYDEKPKTSAIKYYCKYCGAEDEEAQRLTSRDCPQHPNGRYKGNHVLYGGDTTRPFYCKCCGTPFDSIKELTSRDCPQHPNGQYKGNHIPYEGFQKNPWICECGAKATELKDLTNKLCRNRNYKGNHIPI